MGSEVVRDAIHGLVRLEEQEWQLVNTRAFQRLRSIKQLALTSLVYPGAVHTRFEHSIGCCTIAGRIAEKLELQNGEFLRLAALAVHDIGHGPFSHVSEEIMQRHEAISAAICLHEPDVGEALGNHAQGIAELLTQTGSGRTRSIGRDLIAGPADADKFDYLLRDSRFCGVEYGMYDLEKILESAVEVPDYGPFTALGFKEEAVFALEEMVLARHHMHRQVYGHKTRIATDRMLVRALRFAIDEGVLPTDVFSPPTDLCDEFVREFLRFNDHSVTLALLAANDKTCGEIMRSLVERRLYKRMITLTYQELSEELGQYLGGLAALPDVEAMIPHAEIIKETEERMAAEINIDPYWVCLHWESLKSPTASMQSLKIDDKEIVLVDREGKPKKFLDSSEIFQNEERPPMSYVHAFVRPESREVSPEKQDAMRRILLDGLDRIGRAQAEL